MNDEPLYPSNHNLASLSPQEQARYTIDSELERPRERWKELSAGVSKCPAEITSQSNAEAATTLVAQLQALKSKIDDVHRDVKEPFLEAGRVVDNAKNLLADLVETAKRDLSDRIAAFQVREQQRIEAERLALLEKEAGDPEPSWAPPSVRSRRATRVRSLEGATASLVDVTTIEILDVTKIPLRYLNRPKVLEALRKEIQPDAAKGDKIEGIKVHKGAATRVTK